MSKTAVELLAVKRRELADAEAALTRAKAARDTNAEVDALRRVEVVKRHITELELESTAERDAEGKLKAEAWLSAHGRRVKKLAGEVAARQDAVRTALAAAVEAITAEGAARQAVERELIAADLLSRRFDVGKPSASGVMPPLLDWARDVFEATDRMRPSHVAKRGIVVPNGASWTAEEKQRAALRAVAEYVRKHRRSLPAEVVAILDAAPIPSVVTADVAPEVPEHEQRAMRQMARDKAQTEAALAQVPHGVGIRGI